MHVSSSDHCERTILSTVSIFAKGSDQWRVSPLQCWKLTKLEFVRHLRLCVGKSLSCWCCCVTALRNPVATRNHVASSRFEQEWALDWTNFAMLKEQTFALVQCLVGLANWWSIESAIQFTSNTSTEQRAHMHVSSSDRCERTILSTVSIFAKGQINEECLLRNVGSWKSWRSPDAWNTVSRRFLVADAAVWRLPESCRYQESRCLIQFRARLSRGLKQLVPCCKKKQFPRL